MPSSKKYPNELNGTLGSSRSGVQRARAPLEVASNDCAGSEDRGKSWYRLLSLMGLDAARLRCGTGQGSTRLGRPGGPGTGRRR